MTARLVDMTLDEYMAYPALSASGMKLLLDCPARFRDWIDNGGTSTDAMLQGSLVHHFILGSDVEYVVKDWDGRTNAGKARAAEVAESGACIVTQDMWDTAIGVADAIATDPFAACLFSDGTAEATILWTDADTEVELKCRLDWLPTNGALIPDLKTGRSARPDSFARAEAEYGYAIQRVQQLEAVKALGRHDNPESVLVAVETRRPFLLSFIGMSEVDLGYARGLRDKAIRTYAECTATDNWPGYSTEITYPDAPIWWRLRAEEALGLTSEIEIPA